MIRQRWYEHEFWSVMASFLAFLYGVGRERSAAVTRGLAQIREDSIALVIVPVANVEWTGPPANLGNSVIGEASTSFLQMAHEIVETEESTDFNIQNYIDGFADRRTSATLFAHRTKAHGEKAVDEATQKLRELLSLTELMGADLPGYNWKSRQSQVNRPGIRGIAVDRPAMEQYLSDSGRMELAAESVVVSEKWGSQRHAQWHSAEPMQLDVLLRDPTLRETVTWCITGNGPVRSRLKVAARWFDEAHWADQDDDAALALGVAMDALVGAKSGLPGGAMAERYALLDPEPGARQTRADRYKKVFAVRSSIAHGGRSSELSDSDYIRTVQQDVMWAASRLLSLEQCFRPDSEADFNKVFADLRWGSIAWTNIGE